MCLCVVASDNVAHCPEGSGHDGRNRMHQKLDQTTAHARVDDSLNKRKTFLHVKKLSKNSKTARFSINPRKTQIFGNRRLVQKNLATTKHTLFHGNIFLRLASQHETCKVNTGIQNYIRYHHVSVTSR